MDPANDNLFTWWAPWRNMKQRNIGWRIDYVLATSWLAAKARSITIQREVGLSDHGPVVADFDSDVVPRSWFLVPSACSSFLVACSTFRS